MKLRVCVGCVQDKSASYHQTYLVYIPTESIMRDVEKKAQSTKKLILMAGQSEIYGMQMTLHFYQILKND